MGVIITCPMKLFSHVRSNLMFYHYKNFSSVISQDQAVLIAKIANDLLDQQAKVMYGNSYADGRADSFTSTQQRTDTHVCLAVGIDELGTFAPSTSPIALDKPSLDDIMKAQVERIKDLEKQVRGSK